MQSAQQSKSSIAELILRWNLWILIGALCEDTLRIFWFMHAQYQNERTWTRRTSATNIMRALLRFHPQLGALFTMRSWCRFLCDSQRTFNLFMPLKSTLIQMGPLNVCKCTSFAIFLHYFCCVPMCVVFWFLLTLLHLEWFSFFSRTNRGCCKKCTVFLINRAKNMRMFAMQRHLF